MVRKIARPQVIYLLVIGMIFAAVIKFVSIQPTHNVTVTEDTKIAIKYIRGEAKVPTNKDLKRLLESYDAFENCSSNTAELVGEITELYQQVTQARVCSDANWYFNRLAEKVKAYQEEIVETKNLISEIDEKYTQYEKGLDSIPIFLATLIEKKQNEFAEKILPRHEQFCTAKQTYLDEEENVMNMETLAHKIADDFFNAWYPLMCRIINAEAGGIGCSTFERWCIAKVIENRVKNARFPNTLTEVIYQHTGNKYQYAPVQNGSINKVPNEQVKKDMEEYLRGRVDPNTMPDEGVLYQATHQQGKLWKYFPSGHYLCYGKNA